MSTIDEEMPGLFEGFAAERRFEDVLWFSRKALRFLLAFRRLELAATRTRASCSP